EDGIRDKLVTGVQTCALPISTAPSLGPFYKAGGAASAAPLRAPDGVRTASVSNEDCLQAHGRRLRGYGPPVRRRNVRLCGSESRAPLGRCRVRLPVRGAGTAERMVLGLRGIASSHVGAVADLHRRHLWAPPGSV